MDEDYQVFLYKVINFLPYQETMILQMGKNWSLEELLHVQLSLELHTVFFVLPQDLVLELQFI